MNYLFFDIECGNGRDICTFGYVIVDSDFNILQKDDIIINPEKPFKLARAGFDPKIKLSYSEEEFKKHPNFDAQYIKIKNLLVNKNTVLFGHSVSSDLQYLKNACKRYKKKAFRISAYDTQKIYDKQAHKLENIAHSLGVVIDENKLHNSCYDAEITMLCLKKICENNNYTIDDILVKYAKCKVDSVNDKPKKMRLNGKDNSCTQSLGDKFNEQLHKKNLNSVNDLFVKNN